MPPRPFRPVRYRVATPVFEGPLDLLLQLIERAELDITRLALAQVTDQYLSHLHSLQERAAEEVSAFLVVATRPSRSNLRCCSLALPSVKKEKKTLVRRSPAS